MSKINKQAERCNVLTIIFLLMFVNCYIYIFVYNTHTYINIWDISLT